MARIWQLLCAITITPRPGRESYRPPAADPSLTLGLVNPATGLYSGTWIPAAVSGQVTVTATATAPGLSSAAAGVTGEVVANAAPLLASGGTVTNGINNHGTISGGPP